MEQSLCDLVDADWASRLNVDRSVLRDGGVHVVDADVGANEAMSVLLDETCVLIVRPDRVDAARAMVDSLDAHEAFHTETLQLIAGADAIVEGPSCHHFCDATSFRGGPDEAAHRVGGDDPRLVSFLDAQEVAERDEGGFPHDLTVANARSTQFWILEGRGRVVAAGNMTEWRGFPADVGILTERRERGQGLAQRLVGAMANEALPAAQAIRYRALATNLPSLAVARRLGFEAYGQNYRARRASG